MRLINMMKKL